MSGSVPSAVRVEHVVVGQPGERLAPPGRVAQPADERGERQDRRPRSRAPAARRPRPCSRGRAGPAAATDEPDRQRDRQDRAGPVARRPVDEQVRPVGRGQLPLEELDLLERQRERGQHQAGRDQAVDPIGSRRPEQGGDEPAGDEPAEQREQDHHRGHLLDERQPQQDADERRAIAARPARTAPSRTPGPSPPRAGGPACRCRSGAPGRRAGA